MSLILGLLIGVVLTCIFLIPKVKENVQRNDVIKEENHRMFLENEELKLDNEVLKGVNKTLRSKQSELSSVIGDLNKEILIIQAETKAVEVKKQEILNSIEDLKKQNAIATEEIYNSNFNLMQEKIEKAAEKLGNQYQEYEEKCKKDYMQLLKDSADEFAAAMATRREELRVVEEELMTLRAKSDAAVEALKREEEKKLNIDKYKILLSELDIVEINHLREIAPYFRNARPIYKAIWESYYRTPLTELIHRVVGAAPKSGIYKLTNLTNSFCYIGQAANLSDRWTDHAKAGLGIDTPNSKLYVAMKEVGLENFTFEVLEFCGRAELNDREKYWIDFYRSQEVGYNMRQGGARK